MSMYINGQGYVDGVEFEKTLYANPYLVITEEGYTKHFYIEGERVCSKIGGSGWVGATSPNSPPLSFIVNDASYTATSLWEMVARGVECSEFNPENVVITPAFNTFHIRATWPEVELYFYHSDHLGSSSFITDAIGYATQHLQYLPFGETFVDQRATTTFNSRYTFSAKEKDDETQYSYFGARYYDADLSVWLSVDPMADKYPNLSPFNYCMNNPVMLVDPNGMEVITEVHRYKTNKDGSERELNRFSFRRADRIDITHTVRDMKIYDGTGKESDETMTNAAAEIQNEITDYWNTSNKEGADQDGYITNKRGQKIKVSTIFENNIEAVKDFSSLKRTDNIIHVISGNDMFAMIGSSSGMTLEGGRGSNIIYTTGLHLTPGSFDGAFAHEWGHSLGLDDVRIYRRGAENCLMYNGRPTFGRGPTIHFNTNFPRPSYQEFFNSRYSTPSYFPPNRRYQ